MPELPSFLRRSEQTEHLAQLGEAALSDYDLEVEAITLLSDSWNCVFRLETPNGPHVLRISRPSADGTTRQVEAELQLLCALSSQTKLVLPEPIPRRDGRLFSMASSAVVHEPRACIVFAWVPGMELAFDPTPPAYAALGRLMAQLHTFAESWHPPDSFSAVTYDRVFHRQGATPPDHQDLRQFRPLLERACALTDTRITAHLASRRLIVTHGDLHQWNAKLDGDDCWPIDFEDTLWATPLLDVATSLHYVRLRDDYPSLLDGFRRGYTESRRWVETVDGELDRFYVSRAIDLLRTPAPSADPDMARRRLARAVVLAELALA